MEEAPLPEKPTPNKELEKITDIKEYKLFIEAEEYSVKIGKLENSSKILFKLEENKELKNYYYKSEYSLDNLKEINKVFRIFDTINEAFKEINEIFKNKNAYLQKENNEIILHLTISNVFSLKENISLKLKKEIMNKEQSYELLFQTVNQMKETIQKNKNDFEKRINSLEQSLKEEKQKNETLQKNFDELKKIIDGLMNSNKIDSNIIKTKSQFELIYNRLNNQGTFINKNPKFNLVYRASRDGDDPKDYNNKCQGKKNTVCIIETKKGCIFGGYTETVVDINKGEYVKDPNAFVFSINKMKIYENIRKNEDAVDHCKNWGPIFNKAFAVYNRKFFSYDRHTVGSVSSSHFGKMDSDYEINNGENYFSIKELEVFEIL